MRPGRCGRAWTGWGGASGNSRGPAFRPGRYAARTRPPPSTQPGSTGGMLDGRRGAVLTLVLVTFAALVVGVLRFGWGFNEMAALFFAMGVVAGLVGGLGVGGTADALVAGFSRLGHPSIRSGEIGRAHV